MKKSTILVVALVYIVSFLIVGLFGMSIRASEKDVYVENIKITCPEQGIKINDLTDYEQEPTFENPFLYKFNTDFVEGGLTVQFKAEVLPLETTFKNVVVSYDRNQTIFTIEMVDIYYINVHFNGKGTSRFSVKSTDGKDYTVNVQLRAR